MTIQRPLYLLSMFSFCTAIAIGQGIEAVNPAGVSDQNRTGPVPYTASMSTGVESVDLSSGNLSVRIPLVKVKGRGMDYELKLMFDGNFWSALPLPGNNGNVWGLESRTYIPGLTGWSLNQPYVTYSYSKPNFLCIDYGPNDPADPVNGGTHHTPVYATGQVLNNYTFVDDDGRKIPLNASSAIVACPEVGNTSYYNYGPDANALGMSSGGLQRASFPVTSVATPQGTVFGVGGSAPNDDGLYSRGTGMGLVADSNGNTQSLYPGGTDTIGRTPLTLTQDSSTQFHYTYYDANGNSQKIYVNLTNVSINTSFGSTNQYGYPIYETSNTIQTIQSVVLPNGKSYSFQYASNGFGDLQQITLPTGGTVSYQWSTFQYADWSHRYVSQRTVNDGVSSATWGLSLTPTSIFNPIVSTLTDPTPQHNQSVYTETAGNITDVKVYAGAASGTPLRHYQISYFGYGPADPSGGINQTGLLPNQIVTTNELGQVRQIQYDYDTFTFPWTECGSGPVPDSSCAANGPSQQQISATRGNVKAIREYDGGNGGPGPLLRQTIKTYLHEQSPSYAAVNVVDRVVTDSVYDGSQVCSGGQACSANLLSQTTYSYDQDGAGPRGRVTQVDKLISTSGTATATSHLTYDSFGNITSISDPKGNTSTWTYNDAWAPNNGNCVPSQSQSAYVTQATNALNQITSYTYTPCTGQPVTKRDPNDTAAGRNGLQIAYDLMNRITDVYAADGGHTHSIYNDSTPSVENQIYLTSSTYVDNLTTLDGLGRTKRSQLSEPSNSVIYVDTGYEQTGKVSSVSNPYRATNDATYGTTATAYDALGRKSVVTEPDQSTLQWNYSGNATTAIDEAGHGTKQVADGLGRLSDVYEDPNGMNLHTHYVYDPLGNLLSDIQSGTGGETARTRTFSYDALSRLLTSINPETGTITYSYQNNGQFCAGDVMLPCLKQDPRGSTTSYSYDALNRLTRKTYSDGTLLAAFGYDGNSEGGVPLSQYGIQSQNATGRLSILSNESNAAVAYSYDAMGRIQSQNSFLPSVSAWGTLASATYDLAGNMASTTYPNGKQVTQSWDSAGRLQMVGNGTNTQAYLESITYNPDSSPNVTTYGNGIQQTVTKNNRLQVASMITAAAVGNLAGKTFSSHSYCYMNCGSAASNNGNIVQITDSLDSSRTQGFTYDALNRIANFSLGGSLNQQYTIDSFGNLSLLSGGNPVTTFDSSTNRINNLPCASSVPQPFDAAGNQLCDSDSNGGVRLYSYDAENHISQIAALNSQASPFVSYVYGADGARVRKNNADGSFTEYVAFAGHTIAEKDQTGAWSNYVYGGSNRIAKVDDKVPLLLLSGNTPASTECGGNFQTPVYTIKSGDQISWMEYKQNAIGGIDIWLDYTGLQWQYADETGSTINQDVRTNQWVSRTADLTPFAGHLVGMYSILHDVWTGASTWNIWLGNMAITSSDGTVTQILSANATAPLSSFACQGSSTNLAFQTESPSTAPSQSGVTDTHFYVTDHLGSGQMEFSSGGWPISSSQFLPFGGEINPQTSGNHYKFTGKERDAESGLDYFGARYYGSSMGRFMSPDWSSKPEAVPYSDLADPQSLNLYGYVRNNPLSRADKDGHDCEPCQKFVTAVRNTLQIKTSIGSGAQVSASIAGVKVTAGASTKTITTVTPLGPAATTQKSVIESGVQAQVGTSVFGKLSNTTTIGPESDPGSLGVKGGAAGTSLSGGTATSSSSNASASTSGSISIVGATVGIGPVLGGVELSISASDARTALTNVGPAINGAFKAITGDLFNTPGPSSGSAPSIFNLPQP